METRLSSRSREVVIAIDRPFVIIGERINPTGRKVLAAEMKDGVMDRVRADARAQADAGAHMLDVNAGIPAVDEPALLVAAIKAVTEVSDAPICIDSSIIEALEAGLSAYEGKALVNSVTAEEDRMERILPLVKKHGAAVIGMANDENGISMVPEERLELARRIVERAADHGIPKEDVIIDPIAMTVAADPTCGVITLQTMRLIRDELGNNMTCGGRGTCGKCKVRVIRGLADPETADHRQLRPQDITDGWRLSCQARIYEDMTCEVPQLLRVPKAATMGLGRLVILDPNVRKVYFELAEPSLHDQRSDVARLKDALTAEGHDMVAGVAVLRTLPHVFREAGFKVTAVLAGERLVAVEAGDTTGDCYGVAFDVGTTTLVGTLMNLRTGMAAAVRSTLNGQAPFGADVISRISHAMNGPESVDELKNAVTSTMNGILDELYAEAGVSPERTYEAVVAGNVTMLHLLFGIDPTPISVMPFTPAFMDALSVPAKEVGLRIHPAGYVQTLPALGAYVGADIVSG